MDLNPGQLETLVAIADHGSFDAAARRLHITPSAVSQRIRALEGATGRVLISRGTPCRPTPHGEWLVRLGRQTRLLYDEASQALAEASAVELPVAVNADSLTVWFHAVLAEVARWDGIAIRLHVEDEAHSAALLRSGDVLAAVAGDPAPVQGCASRRLGALRYLPAAAPWFAERWRRGDSPDWAAMPLVNFGAKDDLQHRMLRRQGVGEPPPVVHQVPATADFYQAVLVGLGWGMLPQAAGRRRPGGRPPRAAVAGGDRRAAVLAALAPRLPPADRAHQRRASRRRTASDMGRHAVATTRPKLHERETSPTLECD